ncbi:unnamed protein product [Linum trigynum]|uniref:Uncharacterized protein n=1 Tax=Linum trigynum TaxID=586398 RepID=A0AAV2DVX0_9ROSI
MLVYLSSRYNGKRCGRLQQEISNHDHHEELDNFYLLHNVLVAFFVLLIFYFGHTKGDLEQATHKLDQTTMFASLSAELPPPLIRAQMYTFYPSFIIRYA